MDAVNFETLRPEGRPAAGAAAPIDLPRVLASFRRHLRLFITVTVVVVAAVAFMTLRATPRYTSTATLVIDEHTPDVLHLNTLTPQEAEQQTGSSDSSAVDTEVEILKSRALASKVVDQFHLDQDPEFNGALHRRGRLAFLSDFITGEDSTPGANDPAVAKQREYQRVVDAVMSDLAVTRAGQSYTIDLAFTSFVPSKATAIANAFAQNYLTEGLDAKFDASHSATGWLDGRLADLRQQVVTADTAVEQYKIANNLMSAQGATLTEQEISSLDNQLATARSEDAEQDARLKTAQRQLAAGSNGDDVGEALSNPVIQTLRAQRSQASAHLADLRAHYGEKYPDVVKARRALADIDNQIQVEIQRIISNLKALSEVAHTRTASLASTANQTRGSLAGNNRAMVRLDELQRDDEAARAIYDGFLARYKETIAKEGIQQSDARMVSPAKIPTSASKPNKKLDLIIALVLGLVSGVLAVLLSELLARGISNSAEVEEVLGLPAVGEIPTLASTLDLKVGRPMRRPDPVAYVVAKPLSRFAESFRNLRTSLLTSRPGHAVKVIAVTSALPGEGKTTTALCLARTIALSGSAVVLVDCDLRQRSINRILPTEPTVGLLEVLNGTASLQEALVRDEASGALVLPLAKSAFTPRDMFGSEAMAVLLGELRRHFEVVLLDTAPILAVADTRVLCPQADAVLLLTKWRRTSRKAVESALHGLSSETFIAGVALTQVNVREQALAGEGAAHYYRAYRKYYTG